jgi:ABC-2 type transport system permease protein
MKGIKPTGISALYLANAREFLRDRMAMFLVMLLPVAFAVFFGLIFGGEGGFTLQLGVVNEDSGPAGAQFLASLEKSDTEGVFGLHTGTKAEMLAALNEGDVNVVVALPPDLTASLAAGEPATVEVFYDPARPTSAGIGLGVVRTLLSEANLILSGSPRLLVMAEKSIQTRPLRAIDTYVPGLLGIALLWLGLFGTAMPLVQQREGQVLRRLSVTPLTRTAVLTAQIAWRVTVSLMQAALFLLVGYLGFGVGVVGSWENWLLFAGAVKMGALVFVSLGYFLAGLASSAEGVTAVVQIVNFPMMMLSGSLFAVESLPAAFKPVVAIMPLTYLSDALRQIMVAAPPLHPLWLDFTMLGGWLVVLVALAVKFWRWE